jgi:hypothetical protein
MRSAIAIWTEQRTIGLAGQFFRLSCSGGAELITHSKAAVALYADKAGRQWVARDSDGKFWVLPPGDDLWANRQPFEPAKDAELELMPGHSKYMLGFSP